MVFHAGLRGSDGNRLLCSTPIGHYSGGFLMRLQVIACRASNGSLTSGADDLDGFKNKHKLVSISLVMPFQSVLPLSASFVT